MKKLLLSPKPTPRAFLPFVIPVPPTAGGIQTKNGFPITTFGNDKCGRDRSRPVPTGNQVPAPNLFRGRPYAATSVSRFFAFAFVFVLFTSHFLLPTSRLFAAPVELDYMEYGTDSAAQAAYISNSSVTATGGTITEVGGYRIHTFTAVGNHTFTMNVSTNVEVLVVAGGGSGGVPNYSGGGGAGGLVYKSSFAVTAQDYSVTVGTGGVNSNGQNSIFGSITAIGGGKGGNVSATGSDGGSGGGGGYSSPSGYYGGNGTAGQGYSGGRGNSTAGFGWGGGGGGAGAAGANAVHYGSPGNGGVGLAYAISGETAYYGGGGGGGIDTVGYRSYGGNGGGGWSDSTSTGNGPGTPGTPNTGGGGGGNGGVGGKGIVIVRYGYTSAPLQVYSESSVKLEGSYSLKGVAGIGTVDKTLTRTVSPTTNLTDRTQIKFDIRSTRTGSNIKIGIRDSGGTTTYITPNITAANEYQTVEWDISSVANSDKDAIDRIIIQIVNADAANTFYIDNLFADAVPPAAPTIESVKSISEASIEWNWQDNSSGAAQEDGFKVYSSTGGLLTTRTADTTFWIETGLKRNKEYSRYVRAYNDAGEADSSTVTWRTKPGNYQEKTIVRTGSNAYGGVGDGVIEHNIPVKSGQLATVKVWVRYNTEYGAAEKPTVTLSNLGVSSSQQMSVGSNTWEELTLSGTPSRNGSLLLKIEGLSSAPGARVYADDITVSQ